MKKNSFLWAALSMTAALVMTACSNDDNANESPAQQNAVKTIPYTVTVNGGEGGATTRATVADDPSDATNYHKTLYFAAGDKLYVTGTNIKGVLEIQEGTGTSSATFSGDLNYSGSGTPASGLSLTATLVSAQQTDGSEVTINATTGAVTVNYPKTSYCADVATAVQKYSNLTGTSTYGSKSFTLTQQTAFLNFVITFNDGTTTGTGLSAVVSNNSAALCTANVTTVTDNGVKAKFVLPVAKGTTLSSANVKFGDKAAISFGANQTLDGKVYNVTKTQAKPAATGHALSASAVGEIVGSDGKAYAVGDKDNLPTGVTAVAMVAYVGTASDCAHGLAIALADESGKKNYGAAGTACSGKAAVTGGTWRLPSIKDWQYMFIGCGASGSYNADLSSMSYSGLASKLTTAQGDALQADYYWSSTEYEPGYGASSVRFVGSNAEFIDDTEDEEYRVRACLAF